MNRARLDSAAAVQHLRAARDAGRQAASDASRGNSRDAAGNAHFAVFSLRRALAALDRAISTD
jgi:hypothetical protein